jgi:hypothetical protein
MKGSHQEVARSADAVAREHTTRAVCAVGGGSEADDEHPGRRIAEAGNRPGPVRVASVRAAFLASNALTVRTQSRT